MNESKPERLLSSRRNRACVFVSAVVMIVLGGLVVGSKLGAKAVDAEVMGTAVLIFGLAFAISWAEAIGTRGAQDLIREYLDAGGKRPKAAE